MDTNQQMFLIDAEIGGYTIRHFIDRGGFGEVYIVESTAENQLYALKTEHLEITHSVLRKEYDILTSIQFSKFFPSIKHYGEYQKARILVMELLGPSLSKLVRSIPKKKFSLATTLFIGLHCMCCIEDLHNKGFIHRDIKPNNFLFRNSNTFPICLIDFGLSQSYIDYEMHKHVDFGINDGFYGTPKYASVNALMKNRISRKDDIISLFYSLVELIEGDLPWPNGSECEKILNIKSSIKCKYLFSSFPKQIRKCFKYINTLKFDQRPDYGIIKDAFHSELSSLSSNREIHFEWEYLSESTFDDLFYPGVDKSSPIWQIAFQNHYNLPRFHSLRDLFPTNESKCQCRM